MKQSMLFHLNLNRITVIAKVIILLLADYLIVFGKTHLVANRTNSETSVNEEVNGCFRQFTSLLKKDEK